MRTDDNLLFLLVQEGRNEISNVYNLLYSGILTSLEQKYIFNPHITLGEFSIEDSQKAYVEAEGMNLDIHTTFDSIALIKGDGSSPAKIVKAFHWCNNGETWTLFCLIANSFEDIQQVDCGVLYGNRL